MLAINLFCLPFAGGSKAAYHCYVSAAPESLDIIPLELPGRGARYREVLLTDLHAMVADVIAQIRSRLLHPYALYGHSMGALLCYLLVKELAAQNLPLPLHLFLTGKGAPAVTMGRQLHLLPRDLLVAELKKMGGMPDVVLNDDKMLNFFLPVIQADFQATESFQYSGPAGLNIPMTIITGSEEDLPDEKIEPWRLETTAQVSLRRLPGNHFFIYSYGREILELITHTLDLQLRTGNKREYHA